MGRFSLHIPKTLHNELEVLARDEGISLNQYIIYALTQKVTLEKLGLESKRLTPAQEKFLANVELTPPEQVAEQRAAFEALLSRLGEAATNEEVERYLSSREPIELEPELKPEAVNRLKERIAQVRQSV
jgi:Rad3-related DNA helicase